MYLQYRPAYYFTRTPLYKEWGAPLTLKAFKLTCFELDHFSRWLGRALPKHQHVFKPEHPFKLKWAAYIVTSFEYRTNLQSQDPALF